MREPAGCAYALRMWTVSPTSWTSRSYLVEDGRSSVGTFGFGAWKGDGAIEVDGRRFSVQREGFWRPRYHLMEGNKRVATARSLGSFRRRFHIADHEVDRRTDGVLKRGAVAHVGNPRSRIHVHIEGAEGQIIRGSAITQRDGDDRAAIGIGHRQEAERTG